MQPLAAIPGKDNRRLIDEAPQLERELRSGARLQSDCEIPRANRNRLAVPFDRLELVFRVTASLNNQLAARGLADVDQRDDDRIVGHSFDQRGDILWNTGAASRRIEIPQVAE